MMSKENTATISAFLVPYLARVREALPAGKTCHIRVQERCCAVSIGGFGILVESAETAAKTNWKILHFATLANATSDQATQALRRLCRAYKSQKRKEGQHGK